jgi:hypothetical protein
LSLEQATKQLVALHLYCPHDCGAGVLQVPAPLQKPTGCWVLFAQLAAVQTVVDSAKPSEGQAEEEPLQDSVTSQTPVAGRQIVPGLASLSTGQLGESPGQSSATSQAP